MKYFSLFLLLAIFTARIPLTAQTPQMATPNPAAVISADMALPNTEPALWLVAPRNGSATAPLLIRAQRRQALPQPQISPLRDLHTGRVLPPEALRIRYGTEMLLDAPERSSDFQAIWLTAEIPANVPAGDYRGALRITGFADIPVRVQVADWIAPSPDQFHVRSSLLQSAETIARHYGDAMWSDAHFQRLESSLALMGRIGSHVMYLNLAGHTHFGNEHTHLLWSGTGRNLQPDFSAIERYLVLWNRHLGPPRQIILYMMEDEWARRPPQTMRVSQRSGPRSPVQSREIPFYWRGDTQAWRAAIDGIRQRVRQMGWEETEVLFGVIHDNRNWPPQMQEFFEAVGPGLRWAAFTHGRGDPRVPEEGEYRIGPLSFGYVEYPYATRNLIDLQTRNGNWTRSFPFITSMRDSSLMGSDSLPAYWRLMPLTSAISSRANNLYTGFGRIGFDFWDVEGSPLIGRHIRNHNLYRGNPRFVVRPGPDGAVATPNFEHFREGVLIAEATATVLNRVHGETGRRPQAGQRRTLLEAVANVQRWIESFYFLEAREGGTDPLRSAFLGMANEEWRPALFALYEAAGIAAGSQTAPVVRSVPQPAGGPMRDWTSRDGRVIQARLIGVEGDSVRLIRSDGQTFTVPTSLLSDADQRFIEQKR